MWMAQKITMLDISYYKTIDLCQQLFVLFIWFYMWHYSICWLFLIDTQEYCERDRSQSFSILCLRKSERQAGSASVNPVWNGIRRTGSVTNLITTRGSSTTPRLGTTSYCSLKSLCLHPREMFFTFFVNDVKDIDTVTHKVTLDIVMELSWHDTRLACPTFVQVTFVFFEAKMRNRLWDIQVPKCPLYLGSMVWRPQFQIEGLSKMEVKEVFEKKSWTTELRQKDRYVTDSITFDITLSCPMGFATFPFDQQICNLEVVSAVPKMKLENLKVDIKDTSGEAQDFHIQVQGNTQRCIEDFCSHQSN